MLEDRLRSAAISALANDPWISAHVGAVREGQAGPVSAPLVLLAASASRDWSTKTARGAEIRLAIEYRARGDDDETVIEGLDAIENALLAMPRIQRGFEMISARFLRARSERRSHNLRASTLEFQFRVLAVQQTEGETR